jgi:hypothetical protein
VLATTPGRAAAAGLREVGGPAVVTATIAAIRDVRAWWP